MTLSLDVPWWPGEPERGVRQVPFGRDVLIPITLAILLSFVLSPIVHALRRLAELTRDVAERREVKHDVVAQVFPDGGGGHEPERQRRRVEPARADAQNRPQKLVDDPDLRAEGE